MDFEETTANVKDLIFAYERQTSLMEPLENYEGRQRAKSIGNALSYKLFRQSNLEIHHLVDIEKELIKIEAHLNYYEVYEKDTHVAFTEQLFNVLTYIVSIDPEGHETSIQKKKDLIAETQKLFKILNSKLPFYGTRSYRRTASRREEAVVSSTSRHAILSSSQLVVNDEATSVDLNVTEERPQSVASSTPPPQIKVASKAESYIIPSVSKLKKFFSFRRENKPEVKVTPAAYSGVSRSQSLNLHSNKYTTVVKKEEVKKNGEAFNESDEELFNKHEVLSSTKCINNDENLYVEPAGEIKDYREVQNDEVNSVSVSKLKNLFEDKRKETEEGNYLSSTGLLRNIDIQNKVELNKSKSLSDLEESNLFEHDLSKEIDDFEDVDKMNEEPNKNNIVQNQQVAHEVSINQSNEAFVIGKVKSLKRTFESQSLFESKTDIKHHRTIEERFAQLGHNITETRTNVEDPNVDIEHMLHRTIDPIPNCKIPEIQLKSGFAQIDQTEEVDREEIINSIKDEEPVLKIPVQLRIGTNNVEDDVTTQNNEDLEEETVVTSGTVEALKKTFENFSINETKLPKIEKPDLKVIKMGTDYVHVSHFEKETVNGNVTKGYKEDFTLHRTISPNSNIEEPVQDAATKTEESVTSGSVDALKHTFEHLSTKSKASNNEDIKHILHKTIGPIANFKNSSGEPVLKVPIQLRGFPVHEEEQVVGSTNDEQDFKEENCLEVEENVTSGTVEALKQTFEHPSTTKIDESHNEDIKELIHGSRTNSDSSKEINNSLDTTEDDTSLNGLHLEYHVTEPNEESSIEEQKLNGAMNILASPMGYSTLVSSSSSHSQQISSSSKVSVSYTKKSTCQSTSSSYVSQTSSLELSSQKYFEVLKSSDSPTAEKSTVTITEVENEENPKYKLNISQEDLIDEILKETDLDQTVDVEFEKLLENTK